MNGNKDQDDAVLRAAKLPLPERVTHKIWKVREKAYRDLSDAFNLADENDKLYSEYAPSLGKIARDANAAAQLAGFGALCKYADTAPQPLIRRAAADVTKAIVEKGLMGRPANRMKAMEVFSMLVCADAGDVAVETMVAKAFGHRTPKVVAASLECLIKAIDTYGTKAAPPKPILSKLGPLLGHAQEIVRNQAKTLVILLNRWIKSGVTPALKGAKEVIVKEMEKAFAENNKLPKPKPKELTRSMQTRKERTGGGAQEDESDSDEGEMEEEEYVEREQINLVDKLGSKKYEVEEGVFKDWYGAVECKKWSARKNALDDAVALIGDAQIIPAPFQEIFTRIRKILGKDVNVNVVASSAKLVKALASGLGKNFPPGAAKAITVDLFNRLKEKNRIGTDSAAAALDAMHQMKCIRIVEMLDEVSTASKHKTPKARAQLFLWLSRCLAKGISSADLKGSPLKCFGSICVKGSEDSTPDVREAALTSLAALQKAAGKKYVDPFIEKLDKKRKEKVAALVEKLPDPPKTSSSKSKSGPSANTRAQAKKRASEAAEAEKSPAKLESSPKRKKASKPKKPVIAESDDEGEAAHSPADALQAAAEKFEGFEPENWSVKSFKTRSAAAGIVLAALREKEDFTDEEVSIVLGLLQNAPGLSDSNFIAAKPKLELFGLIASKCSSPPPRKTLKPLLQCAVEKLGDLKASKIAAGLLMEFVEVTSPRYFLEIIVQCAKETKNSRALIGMLKFSASLVEDFGIPPIPEKQVASLAAFTLDNPAPAAKSSAAALACKSASRVGAEKFKAILGEAGASPEALENFDAEMPKYTRAPDPPTRKPRFEPKAVTPEESDESESEEEPEAQPEPEPVTEPSRKSEATLPKPLASRAVSRPARRVKPVVAAEPPAALRASPKKAKRTSGSGPQRISVANHFAAGSRIYADMKSPNWKKRQGGLEEVQKILSEANDCISPNIGEMVHALRARLADSNRNLALLAYRVVSRTSKAMGPGGVVHLKHFGPDVLGKGCIDIKKNVREAAFGCVTTWYEVYGLTPLIPFCDRPLASLNSTVRKELLEWINPRLQGEIGAFDPTTEDLSPMVDPILTCLRDRIAEVRHLADLVLERIVASVGIDAVEGRVAILSKSARLQLEPILEKYRGSVPMKSEKPASSARVGKVPTPRSARQRPQSVALPKPPLRRRGLVGDIPSVGRRARPQSVRVSPVTVAPHVEEEPELQIPVLKHNDGHAMRLKRYMSKRQFVMEELSGANPPEEILPLIGEELPDLASDVSECCSEELRRKLMAPANRFRMHVEAIMMVRDQLEENPDALLSCADVLLRWSACRIEDSKTPPTVLVKLAGFVSSMCEVLMSSDVKLGEYEASAILPPVIAKSGSNRASVSEAMRSALLSISDIVDDEILMVLLTSCLRQPESTRAYEEISEEICRLIEKRCSSGAGIPMGVLPTLARIAGGEDDISGRAAAACLETCHEFFENDLWNLVGKLSEEENAYLEDRLTTAINAMRKAYLSGDASEDHTPGDLSPGLPPMEEAPAHAPVDINNADFRLSVAPAPPSSVLTSISDSLNSRTPMKTRQEIRPDVVPQTPALPSKQAQSRLQVAENKIFSDVLVRLQSQDRDAQLSGLASVFDDLKRDGTLLRNENGWQMLIQLVKCFLETLRRLVNGMAIEDDPAVLKSFLKGVIRFAREAELLRQLDQVSVEYLLSDALDAMIPISVPGVDDWDQVRRGVNLMIVKILELCDQNLLFTAMINLLLTNIRIIQRQPNDKSMAVAKSSICIKSIAKTVKRGFGTCRVDALLRDIHLFLMANPVRRDGVASSEDQTFAMRLLKTVVDAVIEEMGVGIRSKLDLIPQPEKSQLVRYVEMTLQERGDISVLSNPANWDISTEQDSVNDIEVMGNKKIQDILRRMDPREDLESELHTLRAVLICHPNIDMNSHLESHPPALQEYVREGLQRLQEDSETKIEETPPTESSRQGLSDKSSKSNGGGTAGQVYLKRLHEIQLRYGLQSGRRGGAEGSSSSESGEKENGNIALERVTSGDDARGKALSLRERMARIRELQSASKR